MNSRLLPLLSVGSLIAVSAVHAQLLNENFNYTQGASLVAANAAWGVTSAGAGLVTIDNGAAVLTGGSGREDLNHALTGAPYSTGTLWASFTVDLSGGTIGATAVNSYFLHFKDSTTSGFRGRVFVGSSTAADSDLFRIGIENDGNEASATVAYSGDLDRTAAHTVTVAYDVAAGTSKLWVDTATSNAPTAVDNSAASFLAITSVGLRQGGTAGTTGNFVGLHVDDLVVNYTAVPEPHEYAAVAGAGLLAFAMWRRRK